MLVINSYMRIINQSNNSIISKNVIIPKSILNQSLGLLKYKIPQTMLLNTRFGIHTFGMKYAIDVLILDNTNHIISWKKNMKPNRIFIWNPKFKTVLENPSGMIEKNKIHIGDKIHFED